MGKNYVKEIKNIEELENEEFSVSQNFIYFKKKVYLIKEKKEEK